MLNNSCIVSLRSSRTVIYTILALLCALCSFGSVSAAEIDTASSTTLTNQIFRVGFLRRETTGLPTANQLESLKAALLSNPQVSELMMSSGYEGIGLYATDGASDMLRRLNSREFDLAFLPAYLFARQQGGYTVILKSRRPDDFSSPMGPVLRRGIIFVSPRSALFELDSISEDQIRAEVNRNRLAVVSSLSIAGFYSPILELWELFKVRATTAGFLWFESSEEVVKAVLSGLADIGACEEGAIRRVLIEEGLEDRQSELIRIIHTTNPAPTDPVVVRRSLSPASSELGRAIRNAIREWGFAGGAGDIQFISGRDSDYQRVRELLEEFDRTIGEVER